MPRKQYYKRYFQETAAHPILKADVRHWFHMATSNVIPDVDAAVEQLDKGEIVKTLYAWYGTDKAALDALECPQIDPAAVYWWDGLPDGFVFDNSTVCDFGSGVVLEEDHRP